MKIAVCDDESVSALKTRNSVCDFFSEKGIDCEADVFSNGRSLIGAVKSGAAYSALFMDINLVTEDGITITAELRELCGGVPVIFVTSYENRAIDGYDVDAFAFVVKKHMDERLPRVLNKLYDELFRKSVITVCGKDSAEVVPVSDILYIDSDIRKTLVHTTGRTLTDLRSIQHFAEELPSDAFVEAHKSIYVNIARIKRINADTLELENGTLLPVSRRNRKPVMYAVMKRVGGR